MFTGIIEAVGRLQDRRDTGGKVNLSIRAEEFRNDLTAGESISINGVCLTVTDFQDDVFHVEAVEETVAKTALSHYHIGDAVNLERALRIGDRLGGHFVLGHVDTVAPILEIQQQTGSWLVSIELPENLLHLCIPVGSIALDGISLTIARLSERQVTVSIIPFTWQHTILPDKRRGDLVNVEIDMLGKYIQRLLRQDRSDDNRLMDTLRSAGFLSG